MRKRIEDRSGHNIRLFPIALSDTIGHAEFYIDANQGSEGSAATLLRIFKYNPGEQIGAGPAHTSVGKGSVIFKPPLMTARSKR